VSEREEGSSHRRRWLPGGISALVLLVCLFYTYAGIYLAPYPGFTITSGLEIASVEPWEDQVADSTYADPRFPEVGDQLLSIGRLTYEDLQGDRRLVPFDGYGAGDVVYIWYRRDGQDSLLMWYVAGPTVASRLRRLGSIVGLFAPFWLAGTIILLFLRPRDTRWWLLILFSYATAIWLAVGSSSNLRVAYASLVQRALAWLLVPVYVHLHLSVPTPLVRWRRRYLFPALYVAALVPCLLELFQVLSRDAYNVALLLVFVGSLGPLFLRWLARPSGEDRLAVRQMLAGVCTSMGPPVVVWIVPALVGVRLPTMLTAYVTQFAFASLPFFYLYALYKQRMGAFEFRANRLLSLYSFSLLCAISIVLIFSFGSKFLELSDDAMAFSLVVSTLFVILVMPLRPRFQKLVDRLAYGATYRPDQIVPAFARRISAALSLDAVGLLLAKEIAPSLLIRQSALLLFSEDGVSPVYVRGVGQEEMPATPRQVRRLLVAAGRYRPPPEVVTDALDWVHLAVPLEVRGRTRGAWLLGRRDPDDYYPRDDVMLLNTLGDQVAVTIENARLYDQARREIAERRRAQEALRESEGMVRALLNATTDSVILVDRREEILSLNQTAACAVGGGVDEIVGLRARDVFTGDVLPPALFGPGQSLVGRVVRSGESVRFEADCGKLVFDTTVYPVYDEAGKAERVAIFVRDITERKRAVQQAIRAERLAAMGYMATALAHEINNPLQIIRSNLDLLLTFSLDQTEHLERLGVAFEEIERLIEITRRVLDLVRPAEDRRQTVPVCRLVDRTMVLMARRLETAGIQVTTGLPTDAFFVHVAPAQIVQVLLNVTANTIQVLPDGGHLDISAYVDGDVAVLILTNDGPRLTSYELEHIFDPFFTTRPEGTGLGLFISRSIIEQHEGEIDVENLVETRGVAFTIRLPLSRVPIEQRGETVYE
jgi:PAS domain S-box-containing protein